MKAIKALMPVSFFLLSGCALLSALSGPRGMVIAGEGYYLHSMQGVKLLKIRAPKGVWYTRESNWAVKNGEGEGLIFLEKSEAYGELPPVDFNLRFSPEDDVEKFSNELEFMETGNPSRWSSALSRYSDREFKSFGKKEISGASCLRFSLKDREGLGSSERYSIGTLCPGFFRKTFGLLVVYVTVGGSTVKSDISLEDRYKTIEPVVQESLHSLQFIEPFSQVAPPGFSIEEQLRRISAGGQPYGPPKFKL